MSLARANPLAEQSRQQPLLTAPASSPVCIEQWRKQEGDDGARARLDLRREGRAGERLTKEDNPAPRLFIYLIMPQWSQPFTNELVR